MEFIGSVVLLVVPIYLLLFRIQGRLTKVETKIKFIYEKNGGKES